MLSSSCMLMLRVPDPLIPHLQASGFGLFPGFTSTALCHRQLCNCRQGVVDLDALAYACGVEKPLQPAAAARDTHRTPQVFQAAAFSRGEKWGLAGTACCLLPAGESPSDGVGWQKSLEPHHSGVQRHTSVSWLLPLPQPVGRAGTAPADCCTYCSSGHLDMLELECCHCLHSFSHTSVPGMVLCTDDQC